MQTGWPTEGHIISCKRLFSSAVLAKKRLQSDLIDKSSTLCHEAMPLYGLSKVVPFFRVARTKQRKQEESQINVDREAIFSVVKDVMGRRPNRLRSS